MSTRRRLDASGQGQGQGAGGVFGQARNKRGTPMYSREDIREQYCISERELRVLEASKRKPIFGCLSSYTQPSPCRRKSLLPACLRTRVPSDENIYRKSHSVNTSPSHRRQTIDYEDESYFKRRPKTICYTDPKKLAHLNESLPCRLDSRGLANSPTAPQTQSEDESESTRRPNQLGFSAGGGYHSTEVLQNKSDMQLLSVERTSYTQPNTPDMPHSLRFRQSEQSEELYDDRSQQKHVSFQKSMSRSATVGKLEDPAEVQHSQLVRQDSDHGSIKSNSSKFNERLLDCPKSPNYYDQKAPLDQILAPILTKAIMQEKLKRSCMRTQATQTDAAFIRKSLPHLPISSDMEKTEMVSQGAQTNGDGKRRLVKSLSEAARYEGFDYEIYDLDDIPPLPTPLNRDDGSLLYRHSSCSQETFENGRSSESILSDMIDRLSSDVPDRSSISSSKDIDMVRYTAYSPMKSRRISPKALSESEIQQEKRRALSLASGYVDVDIDGQDMTDEEYIEPKCVDECSIDLSHSRIFSEESLVDDEEDVFHEHLICSHLSRQSSENRKNSYSPEHFDKFEEKPQASPANSVPSNSPITLKRQFTQLENQTSFQETSLLECGPLAENSSPNEPYSFIECLDHMEESVSESQITVLHKQAMHSSSNKHIASDSENGSYHLTDFSPISTTPSTIHKGQLTSQETYEDVESDAFNQGVSPVRVTAISSQSDDQTSTSEQGVSECSQGNASISTSSSINEKKISKTRKRGVLLHSSKAEEVRATSGGNFLKESTLEKVSHDQHCDSSKTRGFDARKITSPESDSSSSHFTEQETSRSPASLGTNTITSRSDLSRSDSHPNTDQSETSEDYVTCTENGNNTCDIRRAQSIDEKHVSSPPQMEDILEDEVTTLKLIDHEINENIALKEDSREVTESFDVLGEFDVSLEATSLDADTLTSGTYEEFDKHLSSKTLSTETDIMDKSFSSSASLSECDLRYSTIPPSNKKFSKSDILHSKFGDQPAQTSELKGAVRRRHPSSVQNKDNEGLNFASNEEKSSVLELGIPKVEDSREKIKSGMKLDFPPWVTMYGETPTWMEDPTEEEIKRQRLPEKAKKSVKIDLGNFVDAPEEFLGDKVPHEQIHSQRQNVKNWNEKARKQTEELSTPGMVRSPAMHDGFRLEEWTPVRTPGTPEAFLDMDTSEDSGDERSVLPKRKSPPTKAKDISVFNKSQQIPYSERNSQTLTYRDISIRNTISMTAYEFPKIYTQKTDERNFATERLKARSVENIDISETDNRPRKCSENIIRTRHSPSMNNPQKERRKSGEINDNGWKPSLVAKFRSDDHLLGPGDNLRKADSLRSFSPGSDNVFLGGSSDQLDQNRQQHCTHCGDRSSSQEGLLRAAALQQMLTEQRNHDRERKIRSVSHRARSEERSSFSKEWGMSTISLEFGDLPRNEGDDDERGLYTEPYRASSWLYVGPSDELMVWRREAIQLSIPPHVRITGYPNIYCEEDFYQDDYDENGVERNSLDPSEKDFYRRYQAITHRLVHRKASVEMYRKVILGIFQCDKTVLVLRDAGEFGFRIHGSRPVVVSAIESDTPAETSGLEVGDIIMAINDINILDASHSEVVRLAHSGSDTLRLDVARTCDVLTPLVTSDPTPICAGYLYKLSGAYHPPGSSCIARKWKRRWFALKKDNCLYYYKTESEQTPLGALHLLDYSVHALAESGRPYAFTVAKFGGTTLHIAAHSEDARNRWGQVITQSALHAAQRNELIEESARRVQQSPGAITSPDCFGYLFKLGSRWHQWKRRYCVLKDACLYLYHDTDATQAIGVVHLHGYRVQSTSVGGKKNSFELIPPEPKFRHFYFNADSDNDKKRWLAGFEYSIDRWIKVG